MLESIFILAFGMSSVYHGVDLSLGMAAQTQEGDHKTRRTRQSYEMENPIGEVRIETKPHQNVRLFAQHLSSIPDSQDGTGLNMVGAEITVHIGK